jgi:hypothetical protein
MSLSKERFSTMYFRVVAASSCSPMRIHSVERVDRSHQQRLSMPIVMRRAEGFEVVVTPCVFLVTAPGVQEFFADFSRLRRLDYAACWTTLSRGGQGCNVDYHEREDGHD